MQCDDYECLISALADGELDKRLQIELENHLTHCRRCRDIYVETCALQRRLSAALSGCSEDAPDMKDITIGRIVSKYRKSRHWAWAAAAVLILTCTLARSIALRDNDIPTQISSNRRGQTQVEHTPVIHQKTAFDLHPNPNELRARAATAKDTAGRARLRNRIDTYKRSAKTTMTAAKSDTAVMPAQVAVETGEVTVEYMDNPALNMVSYQTTCLSGRFCYPVLVFGNGGEVIQLRERMVENCSRVDRVLHRLIIERSDYNDSI